MPGLDTDPRPATLEQVARRIQEISSLPHVALRVMELANSSGSGAADLKEAMESDPALSARVLRCVNSSAYAVREPITNLQYAIAYLGLKQIRNLAVTAAVSPLFKSSETTGVYSRPTLWRHMVSVGICARLIALRLSLTNFEDIFLAGLLHDVGIILEDQHDHLRFREVIRTLDESRPLAEIERSCLGFDHTTLGERVADTWEFPASVKAAIRYHHGSGAYQGDHAEAVRCVEVANMICTLKGLTSVGVKCVTFGRDAIEGLSLGRDDLLVLSESLDAELSKHASLFEI